MTIAVKTYTEKISNLVLNENNPRQIKQPEYEKLKKSLKDFPEMKELREIVVDENLLILGGHQRILALKDLGETNVFVKQVTGLTEKQKREFTIKDNTLMGEFDFNILANSWNIEELAGWGINEEELKVNINLSNIDDISFDRDTLGLLIVNPPEAPRLKERFELNFKNMNQYQSFKEKYKDNPEKIIEDLKL